MFTKRHVWEAGFRLTIWVWCVFWDRENLWGLFCKNPCRSCCLSYITLLDLGSVTWSIFSRFIFSGKFGKVLGWRPLPSPKKAWLPSRRRITCISTPASSQLACESLSVVKIVRFLKKSLFSKPLFEARKCLCQNNKDLQIQTNIWKRDKSYLL